MNEKSVYELPEIFEIGDASEMTLGSPALPCIDACDCTKKSADEEEGVVMA